MLVNLEKKATRLFEKINKIYWRKKEDRFFIELLLFF